MTRERASVLRYTHVVCLVLNKFVELSLVEIVSYGDRPSSLQLNVKFQISATVPQLYHSTTHSTYVHSIFTIESQ